MNKQFEISKFFTIETTKSFDIGMLKKGTDYDYITRTVMNRGISQKTGLIDIDSLNPKNTFSLELMNLTFFFRENDWYAGQFIRIIYPKFEEIVTCWQWFECILNGISKLLRTILIRDVDNTFLKSKFELPIMVDSNNNILYDQNKTYHENGYIPDWSAIRNMILKINNEYIPYLEKENNDRLNKYKEIFDINDLKNISTLSNPKFEEFVIDDLFKIFTGRDIIIRDAKKGNIPLVSHTNVNNGIKKRIEKLSNRILFDHLKTIALADRGLFWASVQDEDFHIGTRVKALVLKDGVKNKNILFYLATSINGLQKEFDEYLINATDKLPLLKIWLPIKVDLKGNTIIDSKKSYHKLGYVPDWNYMDSYIENICKQVITDLATYQDNEIEKIKGILKNK